MSPRLDLAVESEASTCSPDLPVHDDIRRFGLRCQPGAEACTLSRGSLHDAICLRRDLDSAEGRNLAV
jgi:hypothetical protein